MKTPRMKKLKVSIGETAEDIRVTNADTGELIKDCEIIWLYLHPDCDRPMAADIVFGYGTEMQTYPVTEFTYTLEVDDTPSVEQEILFHKELLFIRDKLYQRVEENFSSLSPQAMQELEDTINNDLCEYVSRYSKGTAEERKGLLQEFKNKRYYVKEEDTEDEEAPDPDED